MNVQQFLEVLPAAASHPLSFVAYVITLITWGALVYRSARMKSLLQKIEHLPADDRLAALRTEMGEATPPSSMTVAEWLEAKRTRYRLIIVLVGILAATVIAALAIVLIREKEGELETSITTPIDSRIAEAIDRQDGSAQDVLAESASADAYYEMLRTGGRLGRLRHVSSRYQDSSILLSNNTNDTLVVSSVKIRVLRSELDPTPIPGASGGIRRFYFSNKGWGPMENVRVSYAFDRETFEGLVSARDGDQRRELLRAIRRSGSSTISTTAETLDRSLSVDIPSESLSEFEAIGYHGRIPFRVDLSYRLPTGASVSGQTVVWVELEPDVGAYMPPTAYYPFFLAAGQAGYEVESPATHVVAAGESDHFRLQFRTDKSADFEIEIEVIAAGGEVIGSDEMSFSMVVPRGSQSDEEPAAKNAAIQSVVQFQALIALGRDEYARGLLAADSRKLLDPDLLESLRSHPVIAEGNRFWEGGSFRLRAFVSSDDQNRGWIAYEFDRNGRILDVTPSP